MTNETFPGNSFGQFFPLLAVELLMVCTDIFYLLPSFLFLIFYFILFHSLFAVMPTSGYGVQNALSAVRMTE